MSTGTIVFNKDLGLWAFTGYENQEPEGMITIEQDEQEDWDDGTTHYRNWDNEITDEPGWTIQWYPMTEGTFYRVWGKTRELALADAHEVQCTELYERYKDAPSMQEAMRAIRGDAALHDMEVAAKHAETKAFNESPLGSIVNKMLKSAAEDLAKRITHDFLYGRNK